jgi:cell division protein FtsI (penicillin-binding protein 3)
MSFSAAMRRVRQALVGRGAKTQPGRFNASRAKLIEYGALSAFVVITGRAVMLHLFPAADESLHKVADNQYQREIELASYRGAIYDRRGEPLAISIRRPSLAVNPRVFDPEPEEVRRLAHILGMPKKKIQEISERKNYFAWLARQIDHRVADEVTNLGLDGLVTIPEPSRFYPSGSAASHVIGFMGLDDRGLSGLERQFDKQLRGQALKVMAAKDARGNFIFDEAAVAAPLKQGHSIHLTIDRVIQEIAEEALEAGVHRARAKKGYAIVSDPHTGQILAIANYPTFDPNDTKKLKIEQTTNHALNDAFEPGSVTKPFLVAKALEAHKTTPDEIYDTENGVLRIGSSRIHDDHPAKALSTTDIIIRSSNIGTFKISQRLGKQQTDEALRVFGFGGSGGTLDFPGEARGRVAPWTRWKTIQWATTAFGHGFVTTGLELVQAMGAIANGGTLMPPSLIERVVSADGLVVTSAPVTPIRRAINPETALVMRQILSKVVIDPHGSAKRAATKDYTTAGKTGTAQKVDPVTRGYSKDKRLASFVGFAPVTDPHLVVYVQIDEPNEKPYYGGLWAAPVFSVIAERSLKYLNVAPDKTPADRAAEKAVAGVDPEDPASAKTAPAKVAPAKAAPTKVATSPAAKGKLKL